jgi:1-acyl-sn-glycerol-3-phosphate acyltransferase
LALSLRQTVRVGRLAVHLVSGLTLSGVVFPVIPRRARAAVFGWWSRRLLHILRVRVRVHGTAGAAPAGATTLVLSNHVSWLDIFVIRASLDCRFVAKSDIRQWPVVGWLVARQGTVFVQRAKRSDTARVNAALDDALAGGERMVVFAEGSTTDGTEVRPFHASLLQPVVRSAGYALPVALRYVTHDGRIDQRAAYAGETSLWESTLMLTEKPEVLAELHLLPAVHAVGRHRRDLAEHCSGMVADALSLPRPGRRSGTPADPPAGAP